MHSVPFPGSFESDLLLVFPPFQRLIVSMENIGIEYIASYARAKGFDVRIVNAGLHGLTADDITRIIKQSRFRVLGISSIHWTMKAALDIAMAARYYHPDCHIIMGGIEPALNAKKILTNYQFVDSIGMGEGEVIVADLLSSISNGNDWKTIKGLAYRDGNSVIINSKSDLIDPLDQLPFPARDDIAAVIDSGGPVSVSTSRGCFGSCSFCSVMAFYNLSQGRCWRGRSPYSVINEICDLHESYGVNLFSFIDETVVGPGRKGVSRLEEIAMLIRDLRLKINLFLTIRAEQVERKLFQGLKQAGLKKVEIGIESMAQSQLKRYGKTASVEDNRQALRILEDLDIHSEVFMIPYDSDVTYHELEQNLSFYGQRCKNTKRYDVAPLTMGDYLYPYPGTEASTLYEKRGWLGSDYYIPFRAEDENIGKVQEIIQCFITSVETTFPMSFAGLGNLWINSKNLPEPVYQKICKISAALGNLFIEITEWAYKTSRSSQYSVDDMEVVLFDIRQFVSRAGVLREKVKNIIENYGGHHKQTANLFKFQNNFIRQLYLFGKQRKSSTINDMYKHPLNEGNITSTLINVFTKEGIS